MSRDRLSKEIQRYQMYPVIDGDEDPPKWWRRSEVGFPMLCQLARKISVDPGKQLPVRTTI